MKAGGWSCELQENMPKWRRAQGHVAKENSRATPTSSTPLCELGKGALLGHFQSPLVPQPGRHLGKGVADLLSALREVQQGQETPSLLPPQLCEPQGSQGPLLCPRPDPGSEPPGPEGLSRLLPNCGAPP